MIPRLRKEVDPLVEYTEPINSRIFRKARRLDIGKQQIFKQLREKHMYLGFLLLPYLVSGFMEGIVCFPDLPLRKDIQNLKAIETNLTDDLLDATYLRDFVDIFCGHAEEAIAAFDQVFGERA